MTKDYVLLTGLVRWASVPPAKAKKPHPDAFNKDEPNNSFYEIEVECTEAQLQDLLGRVGKKIGGHLAHTLKRYPADIINEATKEVKAAKTEKTFARFRATKVRGDITFRDIPVIDKAGNPVTDKIGNDSTATVKVLIEPIKRGSNKLALRLGAVQVLNLIPYEGGEASDLLEGFDINPYEQEEAHAQDVGDTSDNW